MKINESLKQLVTVALLTALGHLLSVSLYPIASRYISPEELVSIGLFDSTIMMLLALLGFGLNATATRDIALTSDWKKILKKVQSARISLALLCLFVGTVCIGFDLAPTEIGLVLITAPIFAVNYDFALYGLGKPTSAAIVSFIRQSPPLLIFLALMFLGYSSPFIYFLLLVIFILIAALLVSKFACADLIFKPNKKFYLVYISAGWVGLAGLFIAFQRFGFLAYIEGNLPEDDFFLLSTSLKFLLLAVATKRILIQVFYTKLIDDYFCKMLNTSIFLMSLFLLAIVYKFSADISLLIFNNLYGEHYLLLISLGTCSILSFAVSDAKLLLQRQDKYLFISNLICSSFFILFILFGSEYLIRGINYLYLLITTEFSLAILYRLGLIMNQKKI
jgi:hypothetical protein